MGSDGGDGAGGGVCCAGSAGCVTKCGRNRAGARLRDDRGGVTRSSDGDASADRYGGSHSRRHGRDRQHYITWYLGRGQHSDFDRWDAHADDDRSAHGDTRRDTSCKRYGDTESGLRNAFRVRHRRGNRQRGDECSAEREPGRSGANADLAGVVRSTWNSLRLNWALPVEQRVSWLWQLAARQ